MIMFGIKKRCLYVLVVSSSLLGRSAISIVEDDKRCFACPTIPDTGVHSRCIVPCHYNQRCYLKASHANATRKETFERKIYLII